MHLSENFTLKQLTTEPIAARKSLDNTPSSDTIECLKLLCVNILEPLQASIGKPLHILSGYRSRMVNIAANGSKASDHRFGQAVDFIVADISSLDLWKNIIQGVYGEIPYDQVIYELNSWVHISYKSVSSQRSMALSSIIDKHGEIEYIRHHKDTIHTISA